MAMGAANVIPGVSGGTVAFITGIYERLIHALKHVDIAALKLIAKGDFEGFAKRVDLSFLLFVFLGVFVSILSLAKLLEFAFERYETLTLSFFFGLILASILAVSRQIERWDVGVIIAFILGTVLAIAIAFLPPAMPNDSFLYIFLCGIVAVCSMILPGLSGSYILLLMGNYLLVLNAVSTFNFAILVPLFLGCVVGLISLSRLLSYLFKHFKDQTIGILSGFVAGSLLIIWPWKHTVTESFDGKEKAIGYSWLFPSIDSTFFLALSLVILGFFLVLWMEKSAKKN